MKRLLALFSILMSVNSFAREVRDLGRSARGLLLGDAYTAIADDSHTLYYNPAIMGRHKGFSFWPLNPAITLVNPLKNLDKLESAQDNSSSTTGFADALFNFPIHLGVNYAPGFKMGRFGLTAIVNYSTNFQLKNKYTPMLDVDHRFDKGFIAGWGVVLSEGNHLGIGVKYLQREGLYGTYNLVSKTMMDAIAAGELDGIMKELGQVKGSGWGFDFGWDLVKKFGPSTFTMGLALLDVYTILHTNSNDEDLEVQPQPMRVNLGTSYALEAAGLGIRVSADIRNLEQQIAFMRRVRLGLEIMMTPALSILTGFNSAGYSYGLRLNTGLIDTYLGLYEEDIGEKIGQEKSSRAVIYFSLFDFTFDV